jgi:Na+-translocating ferredoxin:NAD+ oxidoreductase RnfD subunit
MNTSEAIIIGLLLGIFIPWIIPFLLVIAVALFIYYKVTFR